MLSRPEFDVTRRYRKLSPEDTDVVVGAVANLIVSFVTSRSIRRDELGASLPGEATTTLTRQSNERSVR